MLAGTAKASRHSAARRVSASRAPNFCGASNDDSRRVHQQYGMLYAFDPISLKELWNNQQDVTPDRHEFAKFVPPTVAGKKVVLATASKKVLVYGTR